MTAFSLVLLATGCTEVVTPDEPAVTCDTTIPQTWPLDGDTRFYNRDTVEFTLSKPDPSATVIAPYDGEQSVSEDGLVVSFAAADPLEPDTAYTVELDYCRGTAGIDFTTSELGRDLEGELDLEGRVYAGDFSGVRYAQGDGVGQIISTFLGETVLLQVIQATEAVFQLRVALAIEDGGELVQDPCGTTADLPEADFSAVPYFSHEGQDVVLTAYDTEMHMSGFQASGTVSADNSYLGGIALEVTLDTREAAVALGLSAEDICVLAENVGLACEPCADGLPYCGTLQMDELYADLVDTQVEAITEQPAECDDKTG